MILIGTRLDRTDFSGRAGLRGADLYLCSALGNPRAADRSTGPRASHFAPSASGCGRAASGGSGFRSGLRAADHCRSRPCRSDVSLGEMPLFVGWCLPRRRRERRRELQSPLSEGQPSHAAFAHKSINSTMIYVTVTDRQAGDRSRAALMSLY
jgi:hypothetical protein